MAARIGFVLARLALAVFVVLTSGYCLLAYLPFTYHQVNLGGLLPWLSEFARFHSYFYWVAFAAAVLTLPGLRKHPPNFGSVSFLIVYAGVGAVLLARPLLVRLQNDLQSLVWCIAALTPFVWLAALDWTAQRNKLLWVKQETSETRRLFRTCLLSAIYVWLLSAALVVFRATTVNNFEWHEARPLAIAASLAGHLVLFMAIFLLLNFIGAIAGVLSGSPGRHAMLYVTTAVILLTQVLKVVVFVPLSFSGPLATAVALAIAFSLVSFLSGISMRLYRPEKGALESPLALFLAPLHFIRPIPQAAQAAILLLTSGIGAWLLVRTSTMDWEYLIQELIILAIWTGTFGFFYVTASRSAKRGGDSLVVAAAILVCAYIGLAAMQSRRPVLGEKWKSLEEYSGYDVGFRLVRSALSPPTAVRADDSLYTFLVDHTNIPRSVRTDPVDIELAGKLTVTSGPKPDIFVLVIDSLRRDYLSIYNPAVTFTPNIEAFARESAVAQNAFTRYTGTGLSEPSIWTGAMMLHKQYITPFYPMNSLQKLLEFEQYQQFITKDEILSAILGPSKLITELDAGRPTMSCELCRSLSELEGRIAESQSTGHPIFAYTQPQNIHVSVINREGRSVPAGERYPGFDAAYASRIKAMDTCFGGFIQFLKDKGLYDNSIVVLAADHGDSLGERGRWGHAYNVVPEVVRVPLIMHLPAEMRSLSFNPDSPAFLIDITPSLYYLLGHRPIVKDELFGKPLFTVTPGESAGYARSSYLVASSYGPVYGLLQDEGRSLYVADGVEYGDHLYRWDSAGVSDGTVTPEIRASRQQQIRDDVSAISRFYGLVETAKLR